MLKFNRIIEILRHPNSLLHPNTWSQEAFLKYLRSRGVKIGARSRFINPDDTFIDIGRGDYISIGEDCCLSTITILAHDYSWYTMLESKSDLLPDCGGRVSIGNNCFIGFQAVILKDTKIGDNVIIGARAVVKGVIPSNTVWAGCPARQICTIDEYYEKKSKRRLRDACYRRDHVLMTKNRLPSIKEMGLFAVLFLERTEHNYSNYIKGLEFNGLTEDERVKHYFFNSTPIFSSFEEFLDYSIDE